MITMVKPDVNPAGRYSIDETRKALGNIARSTLSQWEKKGYINRSYFKTSLRPFFTGHDIIKCWNQIG